MAVAAVADINANINSHLTIESNTATDANAGKVYDNTLAVGQ